jgi:hypothetical protein
MPLRAAADSGAGVEPDAAMPAGDAAPGDADAAPAPGDAGATPTPASAGAIPPDINFGLPDVCPSPPPNTIARTTTSSRIPDPITPYSSIGERLVTVTSIGVGKSTCSGPTAGLANGTVATVPEPSPWRMAATSSPPVW